MVGPRQPTTADVSHRDDRPVGELLYSGERDDGYSGTDTQRNILEAAIQRPTRTIEQVAELAECSTMWVEKVAERASADAIRDAFGDKLADAYERAEADYEDERQAETSEVSQQPSRDANADEIGRQLNFCPFCGEELPR